MKQILCSLILLTVVSGCGKGEPGANGTPGMTIVSNKSCNKLSGSVALIYRLVTYSTGDVFTSCAFMDSSATYSNSNTFLASQNGAANGSCRMFYDLDAASAGNWAFVNTTTGATATYTDTSSASNGTVVTFESTDCTVSP